MSKAVFDRAINFWVNGSLGSYFCQLIYSLRVL